MQSLSSGDRHPRREETRRASQFRLLVLLIALQSGMGSAFLVGPVPETMNERLGVLALLMVVLGWSVLLATGAARKSSSLDRSHVWRVALAAALWGPCVAGVVLLLS